MTRRSGRPADDDQLGKRQAGGRARAGLRVLRRSAPGAGGASPDPAPGGVVVRVGASGICRSDWHGWQGHDPDIALPHVPGHELAGTVAAVGAGVRGWRVGDRVTVPFVCACGRCAQCAAGDHQVCEPADPARLHPLGLVRRVRRPRRGRRQPGRRARRAVLATAAALGCRFATAFRAVAQVAGCARGSGSRCTAAAASACPPCRSRWRPGPGSSPSTSRPGRWTWPASSGAEHAVDGGTATSRPPSPS